MNNPYHTTNLQQNVTQLPTTSAAAFGYLQQAAPAQMIQQLTAAHQAGQFANTHQQILQPSTAILANGTHGTLYGLDKTGYYTTTTTSPNATAATSSTHPSTILITNNFTQQQPQQPVTKQQQQQHVHPGIFKTNHIRIISAPPNVYSINRSSNNNNSNNFTSKTEDIYDTPNVVTGAYAAAPQHYAARTLQPYYLPAATATELITANTTATSCDIAQISTTANTAKILPQVNAVSPIVTNATSSTNSLTTNNGGGVGGNSNGALVLDRINICINNHYTESAPTICSPATAAALSTATAQQPSPIIPAIQHKPIIDSSTLTVDIDAHSSYVDSSCNNNIVGGGGSSSSEIIQSSAIIVIDEPDSTTTTTPHTPPTTPESIASPSKCFSEQSPSSTTTTNVAISASADSKDNLQLTSTAVETGENVSTGLDVIMKCTTTTPPQTENLCNMDSLPITPPTPTTPKQIVTPAAFCTFIINEDVLIQRKDKRFYLGTVIGYANEKYLVRFDDKSELWCAPDEMRKFGVAQDKTTTTTQNPMCVSCKRSHFADIVEICERCGRGYHRSCTAEVEEGSGVWFCKRCSKPMKMIDTSGVSNKKCLQFKKELEICRKLTYDSSKLSWDEKHRVNEEQIYCYCAQTGKFDHNMLQCCKCRNWFHTQCMQDFKSKLLWGDSFFIFCCTVCNDGVEFLRRLQIDWVDVIHLTLYNLRKHQHQKYHHLIKDIWPFILDKRHMLPILQEWRNLPETTLMECIKQTLKEHSARFICGKETKRDHSYYGLRQLGPPIKVNINIGADEFLTDDLLIEKYNVKLLPGAPENARAVPQKAAHSNDDVYEFRIDDDEESSEDEIPIKRIIDKARKLAADNSNVTQNEKQQQQTLLDVADDNAIDATCQLTTTPPIKKSPHKLTNIIHNNKSPTKKNSNDGMVNPLKTALNTVVDGKSNILVKSNSRKRKAFRWSYKDIATKACSGGGNIRNCDLSSDENSSSSRGTSLDLIIPPPANFLGRNNPFLMITPKKSDKGGGGDNKNNNNDNTGGGVGVGVNRATGIKSSILNTSTLDFSSKLAQLKSAGIFPNLSTSNLAKAAGQPRTVRTIKRRLSAKDITIGPNQEVRRRRTKRLNSHIEVISTTTYNPLPCHFFPTYAKDLNATATTTTTTTVNNKLPTTTFGILDTTTDVAARLRLNQPNNQQETITTTTTTVAASQKPTHGRLLRQRPQKNSTSPSNSRRSSTSSNQSSSTQHNCSSSATAANASNDSNQSSNANGSGSGATTMQDLKQTVNKYFGGAMNRIEAGEMYTIRAKRRLQSGQLQYLIEWGEVAAVNASNTNTNSVLTSNDDLN